MIRVGKYDGVKAQVVFWAAWLDGKRRATRDQEAEPEDADSKEEAEGVDLDMERSETLKTLGYTTEQVWKRTFFVCKHSWSRSQSDVSLACMIRRLRR